MKKLLPLLLLSFFVGATAQTIVSTAPQNKKIILEEFTGIHCQYCPDGHARANAIKNANPGNAFLINVHVGGYATPAAGEPDYRTPFGTAIANQSGLTGYPAGTINRTVFASYSMTAGGTAMGRTTWAVASNQIKALPSYVNVAAETTIDVNTRLMTVHVETYYTGNSPVASNNLNVVLLQNNTLGPQTAGNAGNNYNHQHRLIHMVTGQWGDVITTTTSGTFVDRTYTYTIPASYNGVPAELGDFEVTAFIAEGNQKIISGNGSTITYTGLVANDAKVFSIKPIIAQCKPTLSPTFTIQNVGQNSLTSLPITYNINSGIDQIYNWSGNLTSFQKAIITIPNIPYTVLASNSLAINIPTDANITNNNGLVTFAKANAGNNVVTLNFTPDAYGDEISWNFMDSSGVILAYGGPYTAGDLTPVSTTITLPAIDCYTFNIMDLYGDGNGSGANPVTVSDSNNATLFYSNGLYGSGVSGNFSATSLLANDNFQVINKTKLFPNPSTGIIKINTQESVSLSVIDVLGKVVYVNNQVDNATNIDLTNLQKGVYLVKVTGENAFSTEKLILE